MKPILKSILIGLPVFAAIGGGAGWYVASGKAVEAVRASVERINAAPRSEGMHLTLGYASITRSGFPSIGARLVDPTLAFNDDGAGGKRPQITIDWKHNGPLEFVTDRRKHSYRVSSQGSGLTTFTSAGKSLEIASKPAQLSLVVAAADAAGYERLSTLTPDRTQSPETLNAALASIATLEFNATPIELTSADGTVPYYRQDAASVLVKNRSAADVLDMDVAIKVANSELSKAYDEALRDFIAVLGIPMVDEASAPFAASRAGKQNVDIALSLRVPTNQMKQDLADSYVRIARFDVKNDFYHFTAPFDATIHNGADGHEALVKGRLALEMSKAGGDELRGMNAHSLAILSKIRGATTEANAETPSNTKVFPELDALGPIVFDIDLDLSAPNGGQKPSLIKPAGAAKHEGLTINALSFGHGRWGVDLKGMATRVAGEGMIADFTFACRKCDTLMNDVFDTLDAWQSTLNRLDPERQQWKLDKAMREKVVATIHEIGRADSATGDIIFGIGTPTAGDIRINDKPVAEVNAKLMGLFQPSSLTRALIESQKEEPRTPPPGQ